jgi:hypothetical protein
MAVTLEFLGTRMEQFQGEQRELRDRLSRLESSVATQLRALETLINDRTNILRELIGYQTDALLTLERRVNSMHDHFTDTDALLFKHITEVEQRLGNRIEKVEGLLHQVLDRLPPRGA